MMGPDDGILSHPWTEATELREEKKKIRALEKQDGRNGGENGWQMVGVSQKGELGPFLMHLARDSATYTLI